VVCEYYRQGRCTKGHKCKYSHDLNVERKGGKIDLFTERCFSLLRFRRLNRKLRLGSSEQSFLKLH